MANTETNDAPVNQDNIETGAPQNVAVGNTPAINTPTTPTFSRGQIANSSISFANSDLTHVCDFITELQKNNKLKIFLKAQAANIREAIRKILIALGFSDTTGQTSWAVETLKAITRELKRFQREVIKPILDFEKLVVEYIKKIQQIIAWILSLPDKLIAILKDCLAKLYKLIANTFSDLGDGTPSVVDEVIAAAKETYATAMQTVKVTIQAATFAAAVVPNNPPAQFTKAP
jgi:hypothetical protein